MSDLDLYKNLYKDHSDSQLIAITHQFNSNTPQQIAAKQLLHEREIARRQELAKPHWSLTPGFWVAILAMVFAAIAASPVIQGWFQSARPVNRDASSQSLQSNSVPTKPPELQRTNSP